MRASVRLGQGRQEKVAAAVRRLMATDPGGEQSSEGHEPASGIGAAEHRAADFTQPIGPLRRPADGAAETRWSPGRRGAAALGLLVVLLVAGAGWWLATGRPQQLPVVTTGASVPAVAPSQSAAPSLASLSSPSAGPSAGPASSPPAGATPSSVAVSSGAALLVVDVAGKVRRPGVYRLAPGSRVYQAIGAAGGARQGVSTTGLNLAAVLHDGEQVLVGVPGATVGEPAGSDAGGTDTAGTDAAGAGGSPTAAQPVNLNTADAEQLDALPGIGPALAQHVLDWRAAHGQFGSIDQLQEVSGIGPSKFAALHDLVTV